MPAEGWPISASTSRIGKAQIKTEVKKDLGAVGLVGTARDFPLRLQDHWKLQSVLFEFGATLFRLASADHYYGDFRERPPPGLSVTLSPSDGERGGVRGSPLCQRLRFDLMGQGQRRPGRPKHFGGIAPSPRNIPVNNVTVNFSKPLNPATLDCHALSLTLNGGPNHSQPGGGEGPIVNRLWLILMLSEDVH